MIRRQEAFMQAALTQNYDVIQVKVPHIESKRFKAVVKALGFEIEKKNSLDRALEDIEAGRVHTWSSAEEMFQALGI